MKKLNKKGFTIVELVIVIAVIAILAAVLIPTFSGIVGKANESAALQTARSTLTNALNMSSTAQLAGKTSKGVWKTIIISEGYAYGYTGNQLEGIDYPGAKADIALLKCGSTESDNFNAIAIAADNLITTAGTAAKVEKKTFEAGLYEEADDGTVTVGDKKYKVTTDKAAVADKKYYSYTEATADTYKIAASISEIIGATTEFTVTEGTEITVTKDTAGNYSIELGGKKVSIYLNSDFSKKVVVYTTFG